MVALVSFRVDERLKKRMEALAHLNWSEVLRQYVGKIVTEEEAQSQRNKDFAAIAEAMATIDDLRSKSQSGWSGAEEIKKWRRLRR